MIHQSLLNPVPNAIPVQLKYTVPFNVGDWVKLPADYCDVEPIRSAIAAQCALRVERVSVDGSLLKLRAFSSDGKPSKSFFAEARETRFF